MTPCKQNSTNNIPNKNPKSFFGVTLIELMIAITISSIIALGIGSVYTSSKRSYKLQEEFSRLQENGRFAMNYIARFVRGAGYAGCASGLANMTNDIDSDEPQFLFQTGLEGYEATGTAPDEDVATLDEYPTLTSTVTDFTVLTSSGVVSITSTTIAALSPLPDSDILIARVAEDSGIEIVENSGSAEFEMSYFSTQAGACPLAGDNKGYNDICEGDFMVVSDCNKSIAFQVSSLQGLPAGAPTSVKINHVKAGDPGNKSAAWGASSSHLTEGYDFEVGSEVVTVTTKFFFVGKGTNGPSLFMKDGKSAPLELVEGVENMQVLYGFDADADNIPDRYVPADRVSNFADVTAVRLTILLRSVKNLPWRTKASKPYLLGGMTSDTATTVNGADDKRLRRTMSMTIKLRNRALTL